ERWSDYLSLADPTDAGWSFADESVSGDESGIPPDDDPPALDSQTLLRLYGGSGDRGGGPSPVLEPEPESHCGRGSRERDARGLETPPLPARFAIEAEVREPLLP